MCTQLGMHDDVIKWKHFPRYWPFVRGIHRSPVNSLHKGQWRGALMFSLICSWIISWINNREAGDFRRHCDHYDVFVMYCVRSKIWLTLLCWYTTLFSWRIAGSVEAIGCYSFGEQGTFDVALTTCSSAGGYLVGMETALENRAVAGEEHNHFWAIFSSDCIHTCIHIIFFLNFDALGDTELKGNKLSSSGETRIRRTLNVCSQTDCATADQVKKL